MIERGFEVFVNETIVAVDTSAINVVHFHTASGKVISVDAELSHVGIHCPQVAGGYVVTPVDPQLSWKTAKPTHSDSKNNLYAKYKGVWMCFYTRWETATWEGDKWFESMDYKPRDELKPL